MKKSENTATEEISNKDEEKKSTLTPPWTGIEM